jgi:hypothetical protein
MKINLYSTYFISSNKKRQDELNFCLKKNLQNEYIDKINIFLDKNTKICNFYNFFENKYYNKYTNKLNFIRIEKIPTYKDWIEHSQTNKLISVFSNADIYFDESINKMFQYLKKPNSIICLSRHEDLDSGKILHKNPHWSQDVWAINSNYLKNLNFISQIDISVGQCRCDNKFAYVMNTYGWDLYNPCSIIKCFHKHESRIINYNPIEPINIGALAFVHPCKNLEPSKIDIQVMSLNTKNIISCSINNWLEMSTK